MCRSEASVRKFVEVKAVAGLKLGMCCAVVRMVGIKRQIEVKDVDATLYENVDQSSSVCIFSDNRCRLVTLNGTA